MTEPENIKHLERGSDKVVFADQWGQYFFDFGLRSFDDFFNYHCGNTKGKKRHVDTIVLGDKSCPKVFFLKRFNNPHFKDIIGSWRNFGRPVSQAFVEWHNANLLLSCDVGTYKPVCCGWRSVFGVERRSFLVTEKLDAMAVTEFCKKNWGNLDASQRRQIVTDIANLTRKLHDFDIDFPDLYLWHIFIDEANRLSVIDLHRMVSGVKCRNRKIRNLGRLYWSMYSEYFDDELKDLLITTYMGEDYPTDKSTLLRKVKKQARILACRRNMKPY